MKHARLNAKQWTNVEDERLRSLAISGMNAWGIAAELERTVAAVRSRAERFGISLRRIRVAPARRLVELGLKEGEMMPARPCHLPHNLERSTLQKMSATEGLPPAQLHPAGEGTIAGMITKGWIEKHIDAGARRIASCRQAKRR